MTRCINFKYVYCLSAYHKRDTDFPYPYSAAGAMKGKRPSMSTVPYAEPSKQRPLVVVLIDAHPKAVLLLHTARKRAQELNADWRALHVTQTVYSAHAPNESAESVPRLFARAEQMGGEAQHVQAASLEAGLTHIFTTERTRLALVILGKTEPSTRLQRWRLHQTKTDKVAALAKSFSPIEVIPLGPAPFKLQLKWPSLRREQPLHFFYALLAVAAAYLSAHLLEVFLPSALFRINVQNVSLLFMTACAFTSGRFGLLPGLVAAIAGALTYNYYFVPPYHNFSFLSVTKGLSMGLFFFAAIFIAVVTGQARFYGERSRRREQSTQALFMLYQIASTTFSRQQALETLRQKLGEMLTIDVAFFLPPLMHPDRIEPTVPAPLTLDERDQAALDACWRDMKTTGLASSSHSLAQWRFKPMIAPSGAIGVFAVRPRDGGALELWLGNLLSGIADQTAVIIEHLELTQSMESTRIREEREKLRSMLLSSVSHDLKTPLAGIIGALGVHRSVGDRLSPERRAELLNDALEEAQRLDSFITNILDITRLEGGRVTFRQEWCDMSDAIRAVVKRLHHRLQHRKIVLRPLAEPTEVLMDSAMTEQILQNLLDNACNYTGDGVAIDITVRVVESHGLCCIIRDHGPGIPQDKLQTVFDKYARLERTDSQVAGTGLGLAICKAVMEAQGGWITAENHEDGGAQFTFCFPQWRPRVVEEND